MTEGQYDWHYRIVSSQVFGHTVYKVAEVATQDGKYVEGFVPPPIVSADLEHLVKELQRMVDDIKRRPDVLNLEDMTEQKEVSDES